MTRLLRITALLFAMLMFSGCATYYGAAHITSEPEGVQVSYDGVVLGVTPLTYVWKQSSPHRQTIILDLDKPGYYKKVASFWLDMRHKNRNKAMDKPLAPTAIALTKKGG